jgi:hypothetical protein
MELREQPKGIIFVGCFRNSVSIAYSHLSCQTDVGFSQPVLSRIPHNKNIAHIFYHLLWGMFFLVCLHRMTACEQATADCVVRNLAPKSPVLRRCSFKQEFDQNLVNNWMTIPHRLPESRFKNSTGGIDYI